MRRSLNGLLMCMLALIALPVLAVPLLAQTGEIVVPDNAPLWMTLLAAAFPVIAGLLANLAMDGLRVLIPQLDKAGTVVLRIVSILMAIFTGWVASKFGAHIDPDLHNITAGSLITLFTILAQQGIFKAKADKVAALQGEPTVTQRRLGVMPASARRS